MELPNTHAHTCEDTHKHTQTHTHTHTHTKVEEVGKKKETQKNRAEGDREESMTRKEKGQKGKKGGGKAKREKRGGEKKEKKKEGGEWV